MSDQVPERPPDDPRHSAVSERLRFRMQQLGLAWLPLPADRHMQFCFTCVNLMKIARSYPLRVKPYG